MPARRHSGLPPTPHEDPNTVLERARDNLDRAFDGIARTHAGRPQPEVLAALEKAVANEGVTPRRAHLSALAGEISARQPDRG